MTLKQDIYVPSLDMAWSRHKMAEFFNTRILPIASPGREVTSVIKQRVNYEPGSGCAILYSLSFGDEPEGSPQLAVVSFAADESLQEVYKHHYRDGTEYECRRASSCAIYVSEHRCLVEYFPFDWKLPYLARATNPQEMASALGWPEGANRSALSGGAEEIKVLRYVPHKRCVFRCALQPPEGEDAGKRAVVKIYPSGPLARRTWSALTTLHAQAAACGITVPKPLGILGEWNLVLMEEAPGTSLKKMWKRTETEEQAGELVGLAAAALATFHSLRLDSGQVRSFETYLKFLQAEAIAVRLVAPLLARRAQALLRQVARLPLPRSPAVPSLIHGDFAPSQLLIAEDRVAVVDFDNACSGDPAMDVGNFMAKLHRRAVSKGQDDHRALCRYFLAEYGRRVRDDGLEERARVYQVLTLVRTALHTFRRAPLPCAREGPASLPIRLLEEATACLAR